MKVLIQQQLWRALKQFFIVSEHDQPDKTRQLHRLSSLSLRVAYVWKFVRNKIKIPSFSALLYVVIETINFKASFTKGAG